MTIVCFACLFFTYFVFLFFSLACTNERNSSYEEVFILFYIYFLNFMYLCKNIRELNQMSHKGRFFSFLLDSTLQGNTYWF